MNILITSAGRRVKIIEYFKRALNPVGGKVIATDCDSYAPALYFADEFIIVPTINDPSYIDNLLTISEEKKINAIMSLIDPELEIISKKQSDFLRRGITPILSPIDMVSISFDKLMTHFHLSKKNIPSVPTYKDVNEVRSVIAAKLHDYPFIAKPKKGSASLGIFSIQNDIDLNSTNDINEDLIFQPYFKEREFGIDVYIDIISGKLVDLFIKEKIRMRAGETDKSVSVHCSKIEKLVIDFVNVTNFRGPIDIDVFEYQGEYYLSEINPRFGGGYPHAYECGIDFTRYIINNLHNEVNGPYTGYRYKDNQIMMKYDNLQMITNNCEVKII